MLEQLGKLILTLGNGDSNAEHGPVLTAIREKELGNASPIVPLINSKHRLNIDTARKGVSLSINMLAE